MIEEKQTWFKKILIYTKKSHLIIPAKRQEGNFYPFFSVSHTLSKNRYISLYTCPRNVGKLPNQNKHITFLPQERKKVKKNVKTYQILQKSL